MTVCAAVVVFWTTYAMILPAITWEQTLICSLEEHTHGKACYAPDEDGHLVRICELPEHTHEPSCFDAPPAPPEDYLCGKEAHEHREDCYFSDGALKCTMEAHTHTEDCLHPPKDPFLEEDDGEEDVPDWLCGMKEHEHSPNCLAEDGTVLCGLEAHTHTEACLAIPEAEVETEPEETEEAPGNTDESGSCVPITAPAITSPLLLAETGGDDVFVPPAPVTAEKQANEWQVVSGRYISHDSSYDNTQAQIIVDADGNVLRLRKNLVPTGVENEFYVYLSVEPVYYHDWEEIFKGSGMVLNSANDTRDYGNISEGFSNEDGIQAYIDLIGRYGYSAQGHSTMLVADTAPFTTNHKVDSKYTTQTGKDQQIVAVLLQRSDKDPNPIRINQGLVFSFSQKSTDSFTIVYCAPNSNHLVKLTNIHWDQTNKTLTFPHEAYDSLIETNTEVFDHILLRTMPKLVTDPMADHIEFLNVEYSSTGNTYNFNTSTNTLTWDLSGVKLEPSQDPKDYEQINTDDAFSRSGAFQLVYKVRLKVTDDGFNSAAPNLNALTGPTVYPTNKDTTVTYRTDKMTGGSDRTAHFRIPEVRGLLYDFSFRKLDQYSRGVPGAKFTLKDADGNVVGTLTTDSNGLINTFGDLPWGTYYLEEAAPEGYSIRSDSMVSRRTWEIPLCYTTNRELLIPDTTNVIGNMMYHGDKDLPFDMGAVKLTNYLFTRSFLMRKIDPDGSPLADAQFKLYTDEALTKEYPADFIPTDSTGIFTKAYFTLPEGTYYLAETVTPAGYLAPAKAGVLTVTADGLSLFWNGKRVDADVRVDGYHTTYTLQLVNERSVPLPETGGAGYLPMAASGTLVLMLTWSNYFMSRRKKAGDSPSD